MAGLEQPSCDHEVTSMKTQAKILRKMEETESTSKVTSLNKNTRPIPPHLALPVM